MNDYQFSVVGSGYVGMSLATLISEKYPVKILDIDLDRIKKINNRISPIADKDIEESLLTKSLYLEATNIKEDAYNGSDFIIIATPTNFDPNTDKFDTDSVDQVVSDCINLNTDALIIIKSTIPIGHTDFLQKKYKTNRIVFSPEFLREGKALLDNKNPSRIIVGSSSSKAKLFASILADCAEKKDIPILSMESKEAESVKLFANTYLAMRVSFFNEMDSFCLNNEISALNILEGISHDKRIGFGYNNPSFGYGGYCLPKDTKQLLSNFRDTPQDLISAIVKSNQTRKDFLAETVKNMQPKKIGFYKLAMKHGSDNFRSSAILGLIERLKKTKIELLVHEPSIKEEKIFGLKNEKNVNNFKANCDLIVANRKDSLLNDVSEKVFTRDIYGSD